MIIKEPSIILSIDASVETIAEALFTDAEKIRGIYAHLINTYGTDFLTCPGKNIGKIMLFYDPKDLINHMQNASDFVKILNTEPCYIGFLKQYTKDLGFVDEEGIRWNYAIRLPELLERIER